MMTIIRDSELRNQQMSRVSDYLAKYLQSARSNPLRFFAVICSISLFINLYNTITGKASWFTIIDASLSVTFLLAYARHARSAWLISLLISSLFPIHAVAGHGSLSRRLTELFIAVAIIAPVVWFIVSLRERYYSFLANTESREE